MEGRPGAAFFLKGRNMKQLIVVADMEGASGIFESNKEAKELSPGVSCISVKDKKKGWEPSPAETYPIIYDGVTKALNQYQEKTGYPIQDKYSCKLYLTEGYHFEKPKDFPWKGLFSEKCAEWVAHDSETALSLFWEVHNNIKADL